MSVFVVDIRLNPALYIPCKQDIHQFCEKELNSAADDESLHGRVIECLKLEYVKGQNSVSCILFLSLLQKKYYIKTIGRNFCLVSLFGFLPLNLSLLLQLSLFYCCYDFQFFFL